MWAMMKVLNQYTAVIRWDEEPFLDFEPPI